MNPLRAKQSCVLFVYGSLKRGQVNHAELRGARFLTEARTTPDFALCSCRGYPGLVPGNRAIWGELFRVQTADLRALDEFEGEGYLREELQLEGGVRALAYLLRVPSGGIPLLFDRWPQLESNDD